MTTLIVSRAYDFSRLIFLTRFTFSKTAGGLNPSGRITFEKRDLEVLTLEACERAAKQQRRRCVSRIGPFYVAFMEAATTSSCCEEFVCSNSLKVEFVALQRVFTSHLSGGCVRVTIANFGLRQNFSKSNDKF